MLMTRLAIAMFVIALIGLRPGGVSGQAYPNKPIRMVSGGAAGGGNDLISRAISQGISGPLSQYAYGDYQSIEVWAGKTCLFRP